MHKTLMVTVNWFLNNKFPASIMKGTEQMTIHQMYKVTKPFSYGMSFNGTFASFTNTLQDRQLHPVLVF